MKVMRAPLFRSGSGPVQKLALSGFPNSSLSSYASLPRNHIPRRSSSISLNFHSPDHRDTPPKTINRALSESDAIRSATESFGVSRKMKRTGTRSFPATVSDEEFLSGSEWYDIGGKSNYAGVPPRFEISLEEFEFGGGVGSRRENGIATVTGGSDSDRIKIGEYYEEMLKSNQTDALLLGNYGKFLYEVEKDAVRAEEYYGRAILANPGDGELLSLYGKLIWETERDEGRAKSYFEHAVHASPNDCSILGSYAHFMWEAEGNEEEEEDGANRIATEVTAAC
ncbi:uncharacterized protein LOC129311566 [Prosopis cineraria]|uniref:uncharacterized protein LOC129311566 n=1 Tax=Prosopis cineraria TaxID=364024 RepID=UPI00240F4481|nr:uncharacterized protein LOC129311566 [Prosopis cineraria]